MPATAKVNSEAACQFGSNAGRDARSSVARRETELFGRAYARHRFRRVGVSDHPRGIFRNADIRGVSFGARHPAGDAHGPSEEADAARHLSPGCDRLLAAQGVSAHQDGVRPLSELHRADAVRRPLAFRRQARSADAGSHPLRLRQPPFRRLLPLRRTRQCAGRERTGTDRAPAAIPRRPAAIPDALPTGAASCWDARARFHAPCRSSAINGASWSCARASSAIVATTRS